MANNFIAHGNITVVEAPATLVSGDPVLVGALFGIALSDAGSGSDVPIQHNGVWSIVKTSAQAWAVGDVIYFNGTECTNVLGTGDVEIGVAVAVAANPSSTGQVKLNNASAA